MQIYWITTKVALGFALLVGSAYGQGGPSPGRALQLMDEDGDGRISRQEWIRPPRAFRRIDADNDGFLTRDELAVAAGGRPPVAGRGNQSRTPAKAAGVNVVYPIVDAHVHFGAGPGHRDFPAGYAEALSKMAQRNVTTAIVMPTPQVGYDPAKRRYDYHELRAVVRGTKFKLGGGSGLLGNWLHRDGSSVSAADKAEFRMVAEKMTEDGIVVFGEIGLHHFAIPQMANRYGGIPLDHPLLEVLVDVAARTNVPIDVHFDVVPASRRLPKPLAGAGNPQFLEANLAQFEEFLSANRQAKIVWAHAGFEPTPFRTAELNRSMLSRHPNLYMSIRLMRGASKPSAAMDTHHVLKDEWRDLFIDFSDRFVLGSESMYGSPMSSRFDTEFILFERLLSDLPPAAARKIASENAERIYPLATGSR